MAEPKKQQPAKIPKKTLQQYDEFDEAGFKDYAQRRKKKAQVLIQEKKEKKGWW